MSPLNPPRILWGWKKRRERYSFYEAFARNGGSTTRQPPSNDFQKHTPSLFTYPCYTSVAPHFFFFFFFSTYIPTDTSSSTLVPSTPRFYIPPKSIHFKWRIFSSSDCMDFYIFPYPEEWQTFARARRGVWRGCLMKETLNYIYRWISEFFKKLVDLKILKFPKNFWFWKTTFWKIDNISKSKRDREIFIRTFFVEHI